LTNHIRLIWVKCKVKSSGTFSQHDLDLLFIKARQTRFSINNEPYAQHKVFFAEGEGYCCCYSVTQLLSYSVTQLLSYKLGTMLNKQRN